jgi:hypothetical protein
VTYIIAEIKGIYSSGEIPFIGKIEIIRKDSDHGTVYVAWQTFTLTGGNIAGQSKTYFIGKEKIDKDINLTVISLVIEDILKYGIGRKNAFTEVEWIIK